MIAALMLLAWNQGASARTNDHGASRADTLSETQAPASQAAELAEADRLNISVVQLHKEGKDEQALPLASRVLEIREKALGPDHKLVALALFNLGELYVAQRKYGAAEPLYKRALVILEKSSGQDDVMVVKVLNALGVLRFADRDYDKSEAYYQRALAINEKAFGAESLEAARALLNLAELYRLLSRYEKAEAIFLKLLAIEGKLLQPDDDELEKAQDRYVCLLYESGAEKRARALEEHYRAMNRKPATLVDEVINGRALKLPVPEYPIEARRIRAHGVVLVKVTIDEAGKVAQATATCGHPYLRKASEDAALRARFSPTLVAGQPVKVTGIITYRFIPR